MARLIKNVTLEIEKDQLWVSKYPKGARIIIVKYEPSTHDVEVLQKPADVMVEVIDHDNPPGHHKYDDDISKDMIP